MTTGTVAKRVGVNIDTIRYYERQALLPKPPRTTAGYRTFTEATVQRLRFIKQAQALGFTLKEVKELLALRVTPDTTCADVRKRADAKVAAIEKRIASLQAMKEALRQLVSACEMDGPPSECSLLENLSKQRMA
jgi:Hg(II)-responsive transcriptional regulator